LITSIAFIHGRSAGHVSGGQPSRHARANVIERGEQPFPLQVRQQLAHVGAKSIDLGERLVAEAQHIQVHVS
jgi:hypothetical protein